MSRCFVAITQSSSCGFLCFILLLVLLVFERDACAVTTAGFKKMAEPVSVLELDWKHRDGTKIYASVKIDHCYNQNKDLAPIVDSFCEDLALLLYQDLPPQVS